jgi:hypothetical protein
MYSLSSMVMLAQCCRTSSSYERKPTMVILGIGAVRKSVVARHQLQHSDVLYIRLAEGGHIIMAESYTPS